MILLCHAPDDVVQERRDARGHGHARAALCTARGHGHARAPPSRPDPRVSAKGTAEVAGSLRIFFMLQCKGF